MTRSSWPDSQPLSQQKPMVDSDPKPFSMERCRELLGTEDSGLSDEAIEAIRDQTDALAHILIDIYLDQQRQNELARSLQIDAVRSRFGRKMDLFGNKRLSRKRDFKRSNRLTFAPACVCRNVEIWWPRFVPDGTAYSTGSNWLERSRTPHNRSAQ